MFLFYLKDEPSGIFLPIDSYFSVLEHQSEFYFFSPKCRTFGALIINFKLCATIMSPILGFDCNVYFDVYHNIAPSVL